MKALPLLLMIGLSSPIFAAASPIANGISYYQLQHSSRGLQKISPDNDASDMKRIAIEQCAQSVTDPIRQAHGLRATDRIRVQIVQSIYRNNGDLRVVAAATFNRPGPAIGSGPSPDVEFVCQIDRDGNLRSVHMGRNSS